MSRAETAGVVKRFTAPVGGESANFSSYRLKFGVHGPLIGS